LRAKIATLESENKELRSRTAAENAEYRKLRTRINELEPLQTKVVALESESEELRAKALTQSAEYRKLQAQISELESLRTKVARLEAENRELKVFKASSVEQVSPQILVRQVAPKARPQRLPSYGPRYLGAAFVAFGLLTVAASVMIGAMSLGGLGLASFLIGLLLIYLPSRPSVAPELVEASALSSLANLERVLHELSPKTKAVYLRVRDRLDAPMIFLPLEDNPTPASQINASDVDRLLVVDTNDAHRTGLLLQAPGASLLAFMEKESGVDFMDLSRDGLLDALRSGMVESLEAVADLKGEFTNDGLKLRIRDGALDSFSRSVAKSTPSVASRIGCPMCSAAICGTVKALKRDIVLEEAAHQPGLHNVTLTFPGAPRNEAD